jgi:hypothetical protein
VTIAWRPTRSCPFLILTLGQEWARVEIRTINLVGPLRGQISPYRRDDVGWGESSGDQESSIFLHAVPSSSKRRRRDDLRFSWLKTTVPSRRRRLLLAPLQQRFEVAGGSVAEPAIELSLILQLLAAHARDVHETTADFRQSREVTP